MTRLTTLFAGTALIWALAATAQETTTEAEAETQAETQVEADATSEETAPATPKIEATADTVLATVNGTDITLGHLIVIRGGLPAEYQNLTDEVLLSGILDQLIQQTAVGVEPEGALPTRVQKALDNERRAILAAEALEAVGQAAVTEEALKAAYEAEIAERPEAQEYNASHILVESEDEAKALISELEGGADFAELAKEKSTGPSGPNGGQLGWFGKGAMVPPFEAAVVALEAGGISAPVQTQFGWHVVKLNEVRDLAPPSFEQERPRLENALREDAIRAHIDAQTEAADVVRIDLDTIDASAVSDASLLED